jgi:hypothetical protein
VGADRRRRSTEYDTPQGRSCKSRKRDVQFS